MNQELQASNTDSVFARSYPKIEEYLARIIAAKNNICPITDLVTIEPSVAQIAEILIKEPNAFMQCFASSYRFSQDLLQLERLIWTRRASVHAALDCMVKQTSSNELYAALIMMRSAIENVSNAFSLETSLRDIFDSCGISADIHNTDLEALERYQSGLNNMSPIVQQYALATSIDIDHYFIEKNTLIEKRKDYSKKESEHNLKPINTLVPIDHLSKSIFGVRRAYDFLCQFAHPNFGAYFLYTKEKIVTETSKEGLRRIRTTMSLSCDDYTVHEFNNLILDSFAVLTEVVEHFCESIVYFDEAIAKAKNVNKLIVCKVIQSNAEAFAGGDLCPCCSGEAIGRCCGVKSRRRFIKH